VDVAGLLFRDGTWDRDIWRCVDELNEYRLPDRFGPGDRILDLGAHVGAFTYACLRRGAGHVTAYEADSANYDLLVHNLMKACHAAHRASLHFAAVWRSDRPAGLLSHGGYPDAHNTGGGGVFWGAPGGQAVPAVPFDVAIVRTLGPAGPPLRLVKLDIEGSEWPCLLTSRNLRLVQALCGEYHAVPAGIPEHARVEGFPAYTPEVLKGFLAAQGFGRVTLEPTDERLGRFWAERE
jgi:FkbM family methyltransferase